MAALLAGQPYRDITAWTQPPVTPMALSRYKRSAVALTKSAFEAVKTAVANNDNELTPAVTRAVTAAALTAATDPFLTIAERQAARRARWMKEIEDAGDYTDQGPDYGTLAKLDRNDQTGLELHARLAGRLDAAPTAGSNTFVLVPIAVPMAQALPIAPAVDAEWCEVPEEKA